MEILFETTGGHIPMDTSELITSLINTSDLDLDTEMSENLSMVKMPTNVILGKDSKPNRYTMGVKIRNDSFTAKVNNSSVFSNVFAGENINGVKGYKGALIPFKSHNKQVSIVTKNMGNLSNARAAFTGVGIDFNDYNMPTTNVYNTAEKDTNICWGRNELKNTSTDLAVQIVTAWNTFKSSKYNHDLVYRVDVTSDNVKKLAAILESSGKSCNYRDLGFDSDLELSMPQLFAISGKYDVDYYNVLNILLGK